MKKNKFPKQVIADTKYGLCTGIVLGRKFIHSNIPKSEPLSEVKILKELEWRDFTQVLF